MGRDENNPIAFVPADQVQPFCMKLMELSDDRIIVRVPWESEWTYALLAGRDSDVEAAPQLVRFDASEPGRRTLDPTRANFESDEEYDSLSPPGHEDGFGHYAPVRSYPPNRWLIHDMLGNVSEWVRTTSGPRLFAIGGSYLDGSDDDHQEARQRDDSQKREEMGMRLVITAAPSLNGQP